MPKITSVLLLPVACLILQGCATTGTYGADPELASVTNETELPTPSPQDTSAETQTYIVGPNDKLNIEVFGVEALGNRDVQTDAAGDLSYPLVGTIDAAGKTPAEIAKIIRSRLQNNYIRNPQVSVNVVQAGSQVLTVDGQVEKPGIYPVTGRMSLLRAVATAGGTTEYARGRNVVVFRTVGGKRYAGLYNLEGIRRGNYPDPTIYANDVVVVGESSSLRAFDKLLRVVPLITSPLVLLLR